MRKYDLTHLSNPELLHELNTLVARDRELTAVLLAHLAEVDERRLYLGAGFPTMHAYCVEELGFSDDAAYNRVRAAQAARRFPQLYRAVAEGVLHVTAVRMIGPHLTVENLESLIAMAAHRSKREILRELVRRFGVPATPDNRFTFTPVRQADRAHAVVPEPNRTAAPALELELDAPTTGVAMAPGPNEPMPGLVPEPNEPVPALVPKPQEEEPREFIRLHVSIDGPTFDKLRYAQDLLSHAVPSSNLSAVIDRALDLLIANLEKKKYGLTTRPRTPRKRPLAKRQIPNHVRRAVRLRDGGQCTFIGPKGRCGTRRFLEFDHILPVAHGGASTVDNLRQRCRRHNGYEAELAFGKEFMNRKKAEAKPAETPTEEEGPTTSP